MERQDLFADIPVPLRLSKVAIPSDARQEIIDYFVALEAQIPDNSTDWCRVHNIISSLLHEDDPIEDIYTTARQQQLHFQKDIHELYKAALEMLYAVRHRLEAEYMKKDDSNE